MHKLKKDISPFFGLVKSSRINGKMSEFYDMPNCPERIIRKSFIGNFLQARTREERIQNFIERVKKFRTAVKRASLRTAKTAYVIGNDPVSGEDSLFTLTEIIDGENVKKIFSFDRSLSEELDEMYERVFLSFWNAFKNGGYVLSDFNNGQFVYGTKPGCAKKHLYLVDVDPIALCWKKEQNEDLFWEYSYRVVTSIKQTEFDGNFHKKSRKRIKRILSLASIPEGGEAQEYRLNIVRILNT